MMMMETEKNQQQGKKKATSIGLEEQQLLMGTRGVRGHALICPALITFLSEKLKAESAVAKERRKAREERRLAGDQG